MTITIPFNSVNRFKSFVPGLIANRYGYEDVDHANLLNDVNHVLIKDSLTSLVVSKCHVGTDVSVEDLCVIARDAIRDAIDLRIKDKIFIVLSANVKHLLRDPKLMKMPITWLDHQDLTNIAGTQGKLREYLDIVNPIRNLNKTV